MDEGHTIKDCWVEWKKKGGISGTREELLLHMRNLEGRSPFTFHVYAKDAEPYHHNTECA